MSMVLANTLKSRIPRAPLLRAAAIFAVAVSLAAVSPPPAVRAQGAEPIEDRLKQKDEELQRLRQEIAAERKKIQEVEKRERDVSDYIAKLQNEERLTKRLIASLSDKQGMLDERVHGLRSELEVSEALYRRRLTILSKRLREMYKDGPRHTWQELLQASDFADLLQRYKFIAAIAEQDANLVEDVRSRKTSIARREAELTEKLQEVTSSRQEKEHELARLRENERKRQRSLAELKTSKGKYQKRIEQLAKAERDLQAIIDALEKQRTTTPPAAWEANAERDFQALKGRMSPPVEGVQVRGFGQSRHPEYKTVTFNPGIDIEARAGSPVRAVAKGKVELASLVPGLGNMIIIAHGQGYYTLYVHAAKIIVKQGAMVAGGDLIAETGVPNSGTPFQFQIRRSKTPLNPADWLRR